MTQASSATRLRAAAAPSLEAYNPLSSPQVFVWRMLIFLGLAVLLAGILHNQILTSFKSNPGLNGLIVFVFTLGIVYAFRQVVRLYPEIRWVNTVRISDPNLSSPNQPVLLAPMANLLANRRGSLSLSTGAMRTMLDSLGARLDEARDISRYLVGLLIFLGLLGTFWGLTETMGSIGRTIAALDTKGGGGGDPFSELKAGLEAPLKGMSTAFSASLFGLAGSLVLGFLDLQASQAHNRFYNELEEWLTGWTELSPDGSAASNPGSPQLAYVLGQLQRTMADIGDRLQAMGPPGGDGSGQGAVKELAQGVEQLIRQMRAEQKVVREWVDEQAVQQTEVASALKSLASNLRRDG